MMPLTVLQPYQDVLSNVLNREIFLSQRTFPPPKGEKLNLSRSRVTVKLTPRCCLKDGRALAYQDELLHGCDTWLDIVHICSELIDFSGGGEEVALVDGNALQPVVQPFKVRILSIAEQD